MPLGQKLLLPFLQRPSRVSVWKEKGVAKRCSRPENCFVERWARRMSSGAWRRFWMTSLIKRLHLHLSSCVSSMGCTVCPYQDRQKPAQGTFCT